MRKRNNQTAANSGFTIVELLVATAVFSLVLLVALTGFLQIGHLFYKGVSNAQTQDATRQIVNDISSNLKATPATVDIDTTHLASGTPYSYFCAGSYRYTYATYTNSSLPQNGKPVQYISSLDKIYDPTDPKVNMGLVKERMASGSCPAPCVTSPKNPAIPNVKCGSQPPTTTTTATEMLGNGMRIGQLSLQKSTGTLYSLSVSIVYGDYSVLDYSTSPPTCAGKLSEQRFCAVNQINTSVFEGELHP
jgi:prepilin-type N-terminal cleavage/methylation domain-containing protein